MQKDFFKGEKNTCGKNSNIKRSNFDNLDLLNLPLNYTSDASSDRGTRSKPKYIGDSCYHPKNVEEKSSNYFNPSGDTSSRLKAKKLHHFNECHHTSVRGDRGSTICLYDNQRFSKDSLRSRTEATDEFLIPHCKKKSIQRQNEDRKCKGGFPFHTTASGNLKVNSNQVAFQSDKFSVLVADPSTKVSIAEPSMQKESEFSKASAINTIMKQGLGSLLMGRFADVPIRREKESAEYETRATNEILDPELNLDRLGYTSNDSIDWRVVELPEKKNLYLELYTRITNFTNADCKVYIDNEEFNCHLIVLQCYSEVFHNYVSVKKVELPSDKCSASSFAFIYEWMISGDPSYRELDRENVLDIFNAAKYLKIKDLIEQCWAFIDNPQVFAEDTAFMLYIDAKEKNLPEVRELMLPRIEKFFLMLVSSQDWLELDLEDVQNFLQSNYICVNCEMEVFMAAVRWLKHDEVNRDQLKTQVLSCVRFGNLAPWQLVDIKRNPDNPEFRDLAHHPDVCKMIEDGLAFVIIKYWYGQDHDDYQHWNSILALKEPQNRNWSGTEKTYFTYREFLIYLDQYRRTQMIEKTKSRDMKGRGDSRVLLRESIETIARASPTFDDFFSARKPTVSEKWSHSSKHKKLKITKHEAVRIIERAYLSYKLRKNLNGFARRLAKSLKGKSQRKSVIRRRREGDEMTLSLKSSSFPKRDNVVMRVATPKPLNVLKTGGKNDRLEINSNLTPSVVSSRRKEYITDSSLYYLEHESVLVFGGINVHTKYGIGKNTGKDIYRYLPLNNDWEYVGEMPAPRTHHCVAYLDGRIYVVGGSDPREDDIKGKFLVVDTVWSFEPLKRLWFTEGNLNVRRKNFGLVVCGKYMYAIGGQDKNSRVTDTVERYNPNAGVWEFVAPMKHPRMGIACAKFDGKIWVGGGMCGSSQRPLTGSVECYDPNTNEWRETTKLRLPRCFASFFTMCNDLYLIAGAGRNKNAVNNTISFSSIDIWNKKEQKWQEHAAMEVARHGHTTAYLGTQILIIGGVTTVYMRSLSSVECFCTTRRTWIRGMSTLPNCLSGHATVTLPPAVLL